MAQSVIEPTLRQAFLAALPGAANITAFENQAFEPAGKAKWYLFSYLPNRPEVATLGKAGSDAISGLVQVDINIIAGRGKEGVDADIDSLRSVFCSGARFVNGPVNIIVKSCGRVGTGRKVDGFYRFTVSIEWETRIKRVYVPIEIAQAVSGDDEDVVGWGP